MTKSTAMNDFESSGWTLKGWHVLAALLAFFGVMIGANLIFVYFALTTFSGVETSDAYRIGIKYNARLEEARQLEKLGWQGKISWQNGHLELVLTSEDGKPIRGVRVEGEIGRPSTDRFDQSVTFAEQGSGHYSSDQIQLEPGNWIVAVEAHDPLAAGTTRFRLKERLWLSQ
jgi:nitrogen fixation protein FixH